MQVNIPNEHPKEVVSVNNDQSQFQELLRGFLAKRNAGEELTMQDCYNGAGSALRLAKAADDPEFLGLVAALWDDKALRQIVQMLDQGDVLAAIELIARTRKPNASAQSGSEDDILGEDFGTSSSDGAGSQQSDSDTGRQAPSDDSASNSDNGGRSGRRRGSWKPGGGSRATRDAGSPGGDNNAADGDDTTTTTTNSRNYGNR